MKVGNEKRGGCQRKEMRREASEHGQCAEQISESGEGSKH